MAGNTLAEFLIAIGYKDDSKALDDAEKKGGAAADRVAKKWTAAAASVGKAFAAIGAAGLGAAAGIFKLVDSATKAGDEIAKGARAAGMASDAYQRLGFAAQRSGVDTSAVALSMRNLNRQLLEASSGGAKGLTDALNKIGLSADQLRGAGPEAQLGMIADALNTVDDRAKRVALMGEILGNRAGPQLASLLESGSAGLRELGQEAEKLGLVMGNDALKQSEEFQDALGDMKKTVSALARDVGVQLVPVVREIIDKIKEWVTNNRAMLQQKVRDFIEKIAAVAKELASIFLSLVKAGDKLATMMGGTERAVLAAVTAFAAFKFAMMGLPGLVAGVGLALGVTIGTMINDLSGLTDEIARLRNENEAIGRDIERGRAADRGIEALSGGKVRQLSDDQYEAAVADLIRGGVSDEAIAKYDAIRASEKAEKASKSALAQFDARLRSGTLVEDAERRSGKKAKKSKGGKARDLEIDFGPEDFEAEDLFGEEIDRLAARSGATQQARISAIKAAGASLKSGASAKVARDAAIGQLSSLTGRDFSPSADRTLAELLGDDMAPDVRLAEITRDTQPQVLTSHVTNNLDIDIAFDIDGAGTPRGVALEIRDVIRDFFQDDLRRTSEYVKIDFDR